MSLQGAKETLPPPQDANIPFIKTAPERQAVATFSGWATDALLATRETALCDFV